MEATVAHQPLFLQTTVLIRGFYLAVTGQVAVGAKMTVDLAIDPVNMALPFRMLVLVLGRLSMEVGVSLVSFQAVILAGTSGLILFQAVPPRAMSEALCTVDIHPVFAKPVILAGLPFQGVAEVWATTGVKLI
jgi:hypothetical protein